MGVSFLLRCPVLLSFYLLFFVARNVAEDASLSSFSFRTFLSSEPEIALYGDAQIVNSTVRITHPRELSRGRIMYREPLTFGRKPSFSTYFSFSISPGAGDGLAFSVAPSDVDRSQPVDGDPFGVSPGVLAVVFDTSVNSQSTDLPNNETNLVRINLGGAESGKAGDVSSLDLVLNSGEKLATWVDYDGDSKTLEVRLSRFGSSRPSKALVCSDPVDLSGLIWKNAMFVGISSSNGNSTQTCTLYSWAFSLKHEASYLMHSEPLDPRQFPDNNPKRPLRGGGGYLHGVVVGLIFGAVCGAIVVLLAWAAFFGGRQRCPVAPAESPVHPVGCEHEKSTVTGEKASSVLTTKIRGLG